MATGEVPAAASSHTMDGNNDQRLSPGVINGAATNNNNNGAATDSPPKTPKSSSSSSNNNGGVASSGPCDSNNKIVIKTKRSIGNDLGGGGGQNDVQCAESNELDATDVEDIQRLYETKPDAFRQWLLQRAPSDLLTRLRHGSNAKQRESVSSDLFHRWIAFSPTKVSLVCRKNYSVIVEGVP